MALGLAVLAAFYALWFNWERFARFPLGICALITFGLGLPALGFWQFQQFGDLGDMEHSAYAVHLWNLRHGILHYSFRDVNMWGIHSQYTSVLWAPVQWLAGEPGLKLGKGLCLIAAALLLARPLRRDPDAAAWAAAAVLISPAVASQFFYGFHPEFIAAPALVLALEAYRDGKLGRFLAWALVLACSKEVFTLAVGGILLVALAERRGWKWTLLPGLACSAAMAVYWFLVVPEFAPKGNHLAYMMPSSIGQIASDWFRPHTLFYAMHAFMPMLPLMLAMPKRYWLLPLPLMAFYAAFPDPAFMVMWVNYNFPVTLLCAGGLALQRGPRVDGRILAACAVASLLSYPLWREVFSVPPPNPAREAFTRIRELLPDDASASINAPFTARFIGRRQGEAFGWMRRPMDGYDYVVMDSTFKPGWLVDEGKLAEALRTLTTSPEWTLAYGKGDLLLFRRVR
jgi:hypothetical protein